MVGWWDGGMVMYTCPPIVSLLPPGMSAIVAIESVMVELRLVALTTVVPVL